MSGVLQRTIVGSGVEVAERLMAFIDEWNETAHPFNRTTKSVAKVMAKCQSEESKPLAVAA
jgi:hypothetical protein